MNDDHAQGVNVAEQEDDPDSMLTFFRRIEDVRQQNGALRRGDIVLLSDTEDVLAFWRRTPQQRRRR